MATIYVVRHGKAAAGFGEHADPGLDALGRAQAEATAQELAPLGPLPVYSSPLARARETAEPLAALWGTTITIEPRVTEIPTPNQPQALNQPQAPTQQLVQRSAWLRQAMAGSWSDLDDELQAWRGALVDCVLSLTSDCVVFCHFIAINVLIGAARDDDRMILFAPDNGSVTRISNNDHRFTVIELGRTSQTHIN